MGAGAASRQARSPRVPDTRELGTAIVTPVGNVRERSSRLEKKKKKEKRKKKEEKKEKGELTFSVD